MIDQLIKRVKLSLTDAVKRALDVNPKVFVASRRFQRYRIIAHLQEIE